MPNYLVENFKDILGHEATMEQLSRAASGSKTPHSFIFSGRAAIGKKLIAKKFAAELLDLKTKLVSDVEKCPDFHSLEREEGKKDISVLQIRNLCSDLRLKPFSSDRAVAVVDDAHLMSKSAANALLTAFEEPCAHSYIILVTSAPNQLPETIRSRAQHYLFASLGSEQINAGLLAADLGLSEKMLDAVLSLADGSFGFLNSALGEEDPTKEDLTKETLKKNLSTWLKTRIQAREEISAIFSGGSADALSLASKLSKEKERFMWPDITSVIKTELKKSAKGKGSRTPEFWAEALERTIESKSLIERRNLNPALKLSELFLFFAG